MTAPRPHNLDFEPVPASPPRGVHDEAGDRGSLERLDISGGVWSVSGRQPAGQGIGSSSASTADDSGNPMM